MKILLLFTPHHVIPNFMLLFFAVEQNFVIFLNVFWVCNVRRNMNHSTQSWHPAVWFTVLAHLYSGPHGTVYVTLKTLITTVTSSINKI